ncbi:NAD-dependent epimerase/dehydratase family protein [Thalassotalea mangrovi]|uniref:NAD-dependent epimerase/dehydratase family protein n=1 Tax=Thalassotalea mangrovi TaxID=2572245 RepID=A0A4U1B798_9GAMM|nr:NAD-dependent epimerase/dehydratase family protein [Thalassotalea mangrovi]TKB46320.1 NAD-dependent epimerase/dehydratase family protein [Thalassotalea mangrovi]
MMENVFITGAGGFIGRHLVEALLDKGVKVTALMVPHEPVPESWGNLVHIIRGDVRNLVEISRHIEPIDTLFHLAAIVSDWGGRDEHVDITVHGTEQAIKLALKHQARFVVTTSIAAFGSTLGHGEIDENSPRGSTLSNYEYVKQLQEDVTLSAVNEHGLDAVIIRPANVYGVGSVWVNRFVELLRNKEPALMGSGDWDAGLVHVNHVVQAMILSAENQQLTSGEIFVIADDPGVTWQQYLQALSDTLGLPQAKSIPNWLAKMLAPVLEFFGHLFKQKNAPVVTHLAYRLTGVESIFKNDKAKQLLGYRPMITLEQAMTEIKNNQQ